MATLTINTSLLSNPEVLGKAGKLFMDLTLEHWVDTAENTIENIRLWSYAKGGIETIRAKVIYTFMFPSDALKARDIIKKEHEIHRWPRRYGPRKKPNRTHIHQPFPILRLICTMLEI